MTTCSSGLQSRHRKRSLTTAFQGIDVGEFETPSKKARVRIDKTVKNKQPISVSDAKNHMDDTSDITFIVGTDKNKKAFYVRGELFCNQSKALKNLIETNTNRVICMNDISIETFEFITDYIYDHKHPLLTFTNIVPVLYFAQKYDIFLLIENCQQKLIQKNTNVTNWYLVMTSFQKYEKYPAFLLKYQSFFIENSHFHNTSHIISDNRFYDLSIVSMSNFIQFTEFIQEEKKLTAIYKYLHKNNPLHIRSMIDTHFMKLIDFTKLSNNTLSNGELINSFIENQQQKQRAQAQPQAISRKHSALTTPNRAIKEKKAFKMVLENDNDKQLKVLLNQHGFTQCIKIQTTGQGGVWRAVCSNSNPIKRNVVIKAALQIYCDKNKKRHHLCENIMNEVTILRTLRDISFDGIINLRSVIESSKYYMMVLEDGGEDLLVFTRNCHSEIVNKNMLLSDWQKSFAAIAMRVVHIIYCLHEQNYVHLDLSLENILISNVSWSLSHRHSYKQYMKLSADFKIRLIDFGAAQKCNDSDLAEGFKSDLRVGKPAYCAPNIFKKCVFNGKAADVWSLGVILFTLIIGCNPWRVPCENDELFQWIVLDRNMEKILKRWRREQYLSVSVKELLQKIFVDEKDRLTMKEIKQFDLN